MSHTKTTEKEAIDSKSRQGIFVGNGENVKVYKVYYPDRHCF